MLLFSILFSLLQSCLAESAWGYEKDVSLCNSLFGKNATFIFTANPGAPKYGGIGEGTYIQQAMSNPKNISIPGCYSVTVGTISSFPVVQVVTDEGPQAAQTCTFQILACGMVVQQMIYFGTAGFSPRLGGLLNPPSDCNAPTSTGQIVRPGDLCVTTHATNWDCQGATWSILAQSYPNVCSLPGNPNQPFASEFSNPTVAGYRGYDCYVAPIAPETSLNLASRIIKSGSNGTNQITPPLAIQQYSQWYWGNTSLAMGFPFTVNVSSPPTIFGPSQCGEIDSIFWWQGLPWDAQSRGMVAYGLNLQNSKKNITAAQVVTASAMEGIGFLGGVTQAYKLTNRSIPYTIIRAASDWVHQPVVQVNYNNTPTWIQGPSVAVPPGLSSGDASATVFAIQSGSVLILETLRQLCIEAGNPSSTCDFKPPSPPSSSSTSLTVIPFLFIILLLL